MPTGACGINCDVCRLNLKGVCTTCGAGNSKEGAAKAEAQTRILGSPCPILACARLNNIGYCLGDCVSFPCQNFQSGPYPFSDGFLSMQQRRRQERPSYNPDGSHLEVAEEYWRATSARDDLVLCNLTFFESVGPGRFQFRFLNEDIQVDLRKQALYRLCKDDLWVADNDPLLELATVLYLKNVQAIYPLGRDIVSARDLKEGHFFTGPHTFRTDPLLKRYGEDLSGFKEHCAALGGSPMDMADAAFMMLPFPRLPIYLLLWKGDDEFKPRLQVLFDRSIELILPSDTIWALVNRVVAAFGDV
jgi:hypothetical protein